MVGDRLGAAVGRGHRLGQVGGDLRSHLVGQLGVADLDGTLAGHSTPPLTEVYYATGYTVVLYGFPVMKPLLISVFRASPVAERRSSSIEPRWVWAGAWVEALIIILIGSVLRLRQYAANRSLWLDEAMLSLNLTRRSFSGLLLPLDDNQGAPIGFLLIVKSTLLGLGTSEYVLRLVPLLSGLASLPLFYGVSRRLTGKTAAAIGTLLLALADPLIYYSSEVKQYASDVLMTLMVLGAVPLSNEWRPGHLMRLAAVGTFGLWFSHPLIFVLGGIWIALMVWALPGSRAQRPSGRLAVLAVVAIGVAVFLLEERFFLRAMRSNLTLGEYWKHAFLPFPPRSAVEMRAWINAFFSMFSETIGVSTTGLAGVAFVVGTVVLWRRDARAIGCLVFPLALTAAASAVGQYPFSGRLLLFCAPLIVIPVATGVAHILEAVGDRQLVGGAFLAFLLLDPAWNAVALMRYPRQVEELRPVVQDLADRARQGDVLYIYYGAGPAWHYYFERQPVRNVQTVFGIKSRENLPAYRADLEALRGRSRVWFVFSHVYSGSGVDERRYILAVLDDMGIRLGQSSSHGSSAYLYDLTMARRPGVSDERHASLPDRRSSTTALP